MIAETFETYPHEDYSEVMVHEKAVKCNKCDISSMVRGTKINVKESVREWGIKAILKKSGL